MRKIFQKIILTMLIFFSFSATGEAGLNTWTGTGGPTGGSIGQIISAPDGSFFIGTSAGVYRGVLSGSDIAWSDFNNGRIGAVNALGGNNVSSLLLSGDGSTLYAAPSGSGIFRGTITSTGGNVTVVWSDFNNGNFGSPNALGDAYANDLVFSSDGYLYAGTNEGIFRRRVPGTANWENFNNGTIGATNALGNRTIVSLLIQDGFLYAGTYRGIYRRALTGSSPWENFNNGPLGSTNALPDLSVGSLLIHDGFLYAATTRGIHRRSLTGSPNWGNFSDTTLSDSQSITSLLFLADGFLYAGTSSNSGIYRRSLSESTSSWSSFNNEGMGSTGTLGDLRVNALLSSNGYLYAGTETGLYRRLLSGSPDWSLLNGAGSGALVANSFYNKTLVMSPFGNRIYAATVNGSFYIGNVSGSSISWSAAESIAGASVLRFSPDGGTLYAGTLSTGLYRRAMSGMDTSWQSFNGSINPDGTHTFSSLSINDLLPSTDGNILYAATNGGGVFQGNITFSDAYSTISWSSFNNGTIGDTNALEDGSVRSLWITDGYLYAGTNSGIFRRRISGSRNWENFNNGTLGSTHALGSGPTTSLFSSAGYLYAGTDGGGAFRRALSGTDANWYSLNNIDSTSTRLPDLNLQNLSLSSDGYLYAATYNSGIYRGHLSTGTSGSPSVDWYPMNSGLSGHSTSSFVIGPSSNFFATFFYGPVFHYEMNGISGAGGGGSGGGGAGGETASGGVSGEGGIPGGGGGESGVSGSSGVGGEGTSGVSGSTADVPGINSWANTYGPPGVSITSLARDSVGDFYIGTTESGVYHGRVVVTGGTSSIQWTNVNAESSSTDALNQMNINSLMIGTDNSLYVGTNNGVYRGVITRAMGGSVSVAWSDMNSGRAGMDTGALADRQVNTLRFSSDGLTLYAATAHGVHRGAITSSGASTTIVWTDINDSTSRNMRFSSLALSSAGQVLYAGNSTGVFRINLSGSGGSVSATWLAFNGGSSESDPTRLTNPHVTSLLLSTDNRRLYAGTDSGVFAGEITEGMTPSIAWASLNGPSGSDGSLLQVAVNWLSLSTDQMTLYTGTEGMGLYHAALSTGTGGSGPTLNATWSSLNNSGASGALTNGFVRALLISSDGNTLYAGTGGGLYQATISSGASGGIRWSMQNGQGTSILTRYHFQPHSVVVSHDGTTIYVASWGGGVFRGVVTQTPTGSFSVTWSPFNGLVGSSHSLSSASVNTLALSSDERTLYAGTQNQGVYRGTITQGTDLSFSIAWSNINHGVSGIDSGAIEALNISYLTLSPDGHYLYAGTSRGLYRAVLADSASDITWSDFNNDSSGASGGSLDRGTINDLILSSDGRVLYASVDTYGVYRGVITTDADGNDTIAWSNINHGNMGDSGAIGDHRVSDLELSSDGRLLYASTRGEGMYRGFISTGTGGTTSVVWSSLNNGPPTNLGALLNLDNYSFSFFPGQDSLYVGSVGIYQGRLSGSAESPQAFWTLDNSLPTSSPIIALTKSTTPRLTFFALENSGSLYINQPFFCGDARTTTGEECDDGNFITESCSYGSRSCTVCNNLCRNVSGATSYCGDSRVDRLHTEVCDDGNANSGDGCATDCKSVESGYSCPSAGGPCTLNQVVGGSGGSSGVSGSGGISGSSGMAGGSAGQSGSGGIAGTDASAGVSGASSGGIAGGGTAGSGLTPGNGGVTGSSAGVSGASSGGITGGGTAGSGLTPGSGGATGSSGGTGFSGGGSATAGVGGSSTTPGAGGSGLSGISGTSGASGTSSDGGSEGGTAGSTTTPGESAEASGGCSCQIESESWTN